jgi:formylglycine-generating enzyme required for sulfatase activity
MDIFKKLFGKGSSETLPYKPEAKVLSTEWAQELSPTLAPDVTLELVRIPAGEFLMGSDKIQDKLAEDDETPKHKVVLKEYLIGKTPLTNAQYLAFVKTAGHQPPDHWSQGAIPNDKEQYPVVNVSWKDAMAFCQWASQVSGRHVRLPGEAEWEKAARGTDGRIWPWGNQLPDEARYNFNDNVRDTTPIGQYNPQGDSPYGCADMAGNV